MSDIPQPPEQQPVEPEVPFPPVPPAPPANTGNPYAAQLTAPIPVQPWGGQSATQAIQTPAVPGSQVPGQQWSQTGPIVTDPTQPGAVPPPPQGGWAPQAGQQAYGAANGGWQPQPGQPGQGYAYPPAPAAPAQPSAAATFFKESEAFSGFREVGKSKFGSERFWSSILRIIGWVMCVAAFVTGILWLTTIANLSGLMSSLGSLGYGSSGVSAGSWVSAIFYMLCVWASGVLAMTICMVLANLADDAEATRGLQAQSNALLERIAANTEKSAEHQSGSSE